MKTKSYTHCAGALLLALALASPLAHAEDEAVLQSGKISYVSGGVGEESYARLNSLAKEFNLKLLLSLDSGAYVSAVQVAISDASGKEVLQATSDGPVFLAKLPPGSYKVAVTLGTKQLGRKVAVTQGKQKVLHFRWASE